jgi:hypothetical protein
MKNIIAAAFILSLLAFSNMTYAEDYLIKEEPVTLTLAFVDPAWDGIKVPAGQECSWAGGAGVSPALQVGNIPAGANALIVEFSDRTFKPNDLGGHGKIGLWLTQAKTSVIVPSVPGESDVMPEGMFIEEAHRSTRGKPGAYLPPCSGGQGNDYYAAVKAVYKAQADNEESRLLGQASIEMGKY